MSTATNDELSAVVKDGEEQQAPFGVSPSFNRFPLEAIGFIEKGALQSDQDFPFQIGKESRNLGEDGVLNLTFIFNCVCYSRAYIYISTSSRFYQTHQ